MESRLPTWLLLALTLTLSTRADRGLEPLTVASDVEQHVDAILSASQHQQKQELNTEQCTDCKTAGSGSEEDTLGFEAIRAIHLQLDDDADGQVDTNESDEFLREELHYAAPDGGKRLAEFHASAGALEPTPAPEAPVRAPDTGGSFQQHSVSVHELWQHWKRSVAYNWTVDETVDWLVHHVRLPQYQDTFVDREITGRALPRMAVNANHYLSGVLGIKDSRHKQKLMLMAMDAVLFGPPKDGVNHVKDIVLVSLLFASLLGCWVIHRRYAYVQMRMRKMTTEMDSLSQAESALFQLQKELGEAKKEKEIVSTQKRHLEQKLNGHGQGAPQSRENGIEGAGVESNQELEQLRSQVQVLTESLRCAEAEITAYTESGSGCGPAEHWGSASSCGASHYVPGALQPWLQLTYELELRAHTVKRRHAEQQLSTAKALGDKLRRKQTTIYGALVSMHGKAVSDVDESIVHARQALLEVTSELRERTRRWQQVERLCGFSVVLNPGLAWLEATTAPSVGGAGHLLPSVSSQALLPRIGSSVGRTEDVLTQDDSISAVLSRPSTAPAVNPGTSSCGSLQCFGEHRGDMTILPSSSARPEQGDAAGRSALTAHNDNSQPNSVAPAVSAASRRQAMVKSFSHDVTSAYEPQSSPAAFNSGTNGPVVSRSDGALDSEDQGARRRLDTEEESSQIVDTDEGSDVSASVPLNSSLSTRKSKRMFGMFKKKNKSKAS